MDNKNYKPTDFCPHCHHLKSAYLPNDFCQKCLDLTAKEGEPSMTPQPTREELNLIYNISHYNKRDHSGSCNNCPACMASIEALREYVKKEITKVSKP